MLIFRLVFGLLLLASLLCFAMSVGTGEIGRASCRERVSIDV